MQEICRKQLAILVICAVGLSSTACYTYEAVKPTELPKINGSYSKTVGTVYNPNGTTMPLVEQSVVHLERADGRTLELSGPIDARILRRNGKTTSIEHPVVARTNAVSLFVKGSNIAEQEFALQDIEKVEVEKYHKSRTLLLIASFTIVAGTAAAYGFMSLD